MADTRYSPWHTLTVTIDGENYDGTPRLDYDLAHPGDCPHQEPTYPEDHHGSPCYLAYLIGERVDQAEDWGIPTAPGAYRARAWYEPGEWYGAHYCDPDDGIEVEEAADRGN